MEDLDVVLSGGRLPIDELSVVPGTVHLVDSEHKYNLQRASGSNSNIILQPQPLSNVNDPLRWLQRKKNVQFLLLFVWAVFLATTVNWNGPFWTEWTIEFNTTYDRLNVMVAVQFLFLGFGCVFLQPTALKVGRRFVYLICTILAIIGNAICINATNIEYMIALNALLGFAAAPVDSLVEISLTDVFFTHERASKLSWLIFALYFGSYIGPVVAGYLPNWQWAFKIQVIIFCVLFVIQLFLMEDTTFRREENTEAEILRQVKTLEVVQLAVQLGQVLEKDKRLQSVVSHRSTLSLQTELEGTPRTYWKRMQLLELEFNERASWFYLWSKPIYLLPFPAVLWGGVVYGAQMMWLSLLSTTQSEIFTTSYGFSVLLTGLTNLAPLVGSAIGMLYGGMFVDWLAVKMAERNHGILEAEFRLYAMIVPTLVNAAGLIAYGIAANNETSWAVPVIVGQGFLGFAMSLTGPICLTYAIECCPKVASEALVLMLFIRNMIGCGFTWGFQAWLTHNGLVTLTWLLFMLSIVINGVFVVFIIFGKRWRIAMHNYYNKITL